MKKTRNISARYVSSTQLIKYKSGTQDPTTGTQALCEERDETLKEATSMTWSLTKLVKALCSGKENLTMKPKLSWPIFWIGIAFIVGCFLLALTVEGL